jgi:hypothetical protein
MLKLTSRITVIKNISTTPTDGSTPILSARYYIPPEDTRGYDESVNTGDLFVEKDFLEFYKTGNDLSLIFTYANTIECESNFRNLTKTGKLILPRNISAIAKLPLIANTSSPIFGRGDRIIIECGYNGNLQEVFRGYITKINFGIPLILELEDQMFLLKQIRAKIGDKNKGDDRKLTITEIMQRCLSSKFNDNITNTQDYFTFIDINLPTDSGDNQVNTATVKRKNNLIPVIINATTEPFTYNTAIEKSVAEIFDDLKKKTGLFIYFDDYGNLRVELPFINSENLLSNTLLLFEGQIINSENLNYQRADELAIKIIYSSKPSDKKKPIIFGEDSPKRGFVGDGNGDSITVNAPMDQSQEECNANALQLYKANKYDGFRPNSTLLTFGEPAIFVGEAVYLYSTKYPERNGGFVVVGVKRTFGMDGYRQEIELGIKIPNINNSYIFSKYNKYFLPYNYDGTPQFQNIA